MSTARAEARSRGVLSALVDRKGAAPSLDAAGARVLQLAWPVERLGEAIEELSRRSGLRPAAGDPLLVPDSVLGGDGAELDRWMIWAGDRLGVEPEPIETTVAGLDAMLLGAGPAVVRVREGRVQSFFLLLRGKGERVRLIGPDLDVVAVPVADLRDRVAAAHEAPYNAQIDRLLEVAGVDPRRRVKVRTAMARERLGSARLGGIWTLRQPASSAFWRQLLQIRLPRSLTVMVALFAAVYGLEIGGWSIMGEAALNGRLDLGWLGAWALVMLSLIPLRLAASWVNSALAIDVGRLLKSRLLLGGLRMDVEVMRRQGAGQMLARVMESQAFESLAVNGGLGALVSLIEIVFAAWLLSQGAGGMLHVGLLLLWLAAALALGWRYARSLDGWTGQRMDMTHALVERMVGHRTTLAQEWSVRRDGLEDRAMKDYVTASADLDRAVTPLLAGIPSGWMLVGIAGLAPAFISQSATATGLAIGLGGVLFAGRALSGVAGGLAAAARAAIAWRQIAPLYKAAASEPGTRPFVMQRQMLAHDGAGPATLIDASNLTYRYPQRGGSAAIDNASLRIRHGERLLVEGGSGGGKSTFASLLVGLRKPDSGLLLLNGLDHHTLGEDWHHFATQAPQFHDNHILGGTLAFNLLMARAWPASEADLVEARELCEELGLGDLIRRMPSGMMQTIGETGWQLSHGEKSRIFLARALLQDAQLTILDESFAALDPETLDFCLDCAFRRARTLMVIAHP